MCAYSDGIFQYFYAHSIPINTMQYHTHVNHNKTNRKQYVTALFDESTRGKGWSGVIEEAAESGRRIMHTRIAKKKLFIKCHEKELLNSVYNMNI